MKILDILQAMHPQFDFESSEDFFEDGYLDSFDLTRLIAELESGYGVKLSGEDLASGNFRNLAALQGLMVRHGIEP